MGNTAVPSLEPGSYPIGQWFEFKFEIDLSSNNWELFIDGVSQGSFSNLKILSPRLLYCEPGDEYYIDDVSSFTPQHLLQLMDKQLIVILLKACQVNKDILLLM